MNTGAEKQTASQRFRKHLSGAPSIPDHILKKPCHLITAEDDAEVQRVIAAVGQRIRAAFERNEISPNGR